MTVADDKNGKNNSLLPAHFLMNALGTVTLIYTFESNPSVAEGLLGAFSAAALYGGSLYLHCADKAREHRDRERSARMQKAREAGMKKVAAGHPEIFEFPHDLCRKPGETFRTRAARLKVFPGAANADDGFKPEA